MFLSDGTVISINLQVEFTESLTMMSGLFAAIVISVLSCHLAGRDSDSSNNSGV